MEIFCPPAVSLFLSAFGLLLLLLVLMVCVFYRIISRPRLVFGPRSYPVVGSLFAFSKNGGRLLQWYAEMLSDSPTQTILVERLGAVRTVVTANPKNVEHILKTRFDNYPKGKPFTAILHDLLGKGIFNSDGDAWKLQRKVARFNTRSVRNFILLTLTPLLFNTDLHPSSDMQP